jgi:hypothetical protein
MVPSNSNNVSHNRYPHDAIGGAFVYVPWNKCETQKVFRLQQIEFSLTEWCVRIKTKLSEGGRTDRRVHILIFHLLAC